MGCCLRPPYSGMEPGWSDGFPTVALPQPATNWFEQISFQLPQGTFLVNIPFETLKASANISNHGLQIWNTADSEQVIPRFNIVGSSVSGFTILLDTQVDSDNYYLKGPVYVIS